jgi:hypothetical protein
VYVAHDLSKGVVAQASCCANMQPASTPRTKHATCVVNYYEEKERSIKNNNNIPMLAWRNKKKRKVFRLGTLTNYFLIWREKIVRTTLGKRLQNFLNATI